MSSLLGIPDGEIPQNTVVSWDTNKIGGEPDWMLKNCELPVCSVCGKRMKLVIQVYCPLKDSVYHRVLYISTCSTRSCWNKPQSWRVQRSQIQDESSKPNSGQVIKPISWGVEEDDWCDSTATVSMETKDWCDDADDWGEEDDSVTLTTKKDTNSNSIDDLQFKQINIVDDISDDNSNHSDEIQQTTDIVQSEAPNIDTDSVKHVFDLLATGDSSNKPERKIDYKSEHKGVPFDSFYLSVVDESDFQTENIQVDSLLKNYEKDCGSDLKSLLKSQNNRVDGAGSGAQEEYEKSEIKGDKHSHKFFKRLKRCPEQCIRYKWNGVPCFITKPSKDQQREVTCPNCKSPCVFELQLMPPLVNYLHNANGDTSEFGTVIIFTCKDSCWSSNQKVLEETSLVQSDPDSHLFKI